MGAILDSNDTQPVVSSVPQPAGQASHQASSNRVLVDTGSNGLATAFTSFGNLPAELRSKVWMFALLAPQIHIIRPDLSSRSRTNAVVHSCHEAKGEAIRLALDYYIVGVDGTCKNYINLAEDTFWIPLVDEFSFDHRHELIFKCGGCRKEEGHCEGFYGKGPRVSGLFPLLRRLVIFDSFNIVPTLQTYKSNEIFISPTDSQSDFLMDLDEDDGGVAPECRRLAHPAIEFNTSYHASDPTDWEAIAEESMRSIRSHREAMKLADEQLERDGKGTKHVYTQDLKTIPVVARNARHLLRWAIGEERYVANEYRFRYSDSGCCHTSMREEDEDNGG